MAETPEKSLASPAHNVSIDDEILVKKFNQGDDSAFDRIVEKYSADIAALANRLLGWPGDVEDVVQNIFLAAFLGLKKFRCDCSLKTWLFTITISKCRAYRYKLTLRRRLFSKIANETASSTAHAASKTPMDREILNHVRRAVKALPPKYREPIVLRYLHGLPMAKVSQILCISQNTLHVRLSRARKRLKQDLPELTED